MINQDLIDKYRRALEIAISKDELHHYIQPIRKVICKLLNSEYIASIDEVVWAECFIKQDGQVNEDTEQIDGRFLMKLRGFTEKDCKIYGKQSLFEDGSCPLISTKSVFSKNMFKEDWEISVIIDEVSVQVFTSSYEYQNFWSLSFKGYKQFKIAIAEEICRVAEVINNYDELLNTLKEKLNIDLVKGK